MGKGKNKRRGIIKEIINKIKEFKKKANVEKIILFGSYARGNITEHSDIDLILVGKRFR
jgi:predicted nucleotidyltransferase